MPSTSNGRESVEVGLVEKESGGSCGTKAKKGMKRFSLINGASMATAGAERAGLLELNNGSSAKTPGLWVTTRCFAVPNLTPETWQQLDASLFAGFLVPFQHITNRIPVMEAYGAGAASYMGYKGATVLVAPQDPLTPTPSGYNSRKSISLWDNGDRMATTSSSYQSGIKAIRPDAYVALCDADTPKGAPNKRVSKAVSKSLELLDDCLTNFTLPSPSPFLFASVQGGFDAQARRACAKQVASRTGIDGYFLDGFHHNHQDSNREGLVEEMKPLINEMLSILPADKARLYHGFCTPLAVLELVRSGVDMFETSFPSYLAENGQAFVFDNQYPITSGLKEDPNQNYKHHWIDLRLDRYKDDFSPISASCQCYVCQKHTRAYIHHLEATHELLAPILLTIHNLHYYGTFFQTIRKLIDVGKLQVLYDILKPAENTQV